MIWCNLETIFYILGRALFQHGRSTRTLENLRTEESSHGMAVTFSYIWFGTWGEVCAWLFLMPTDTPLGFEGAKKQNSYQKRLWKTTYDKKTEAVKRRMPSWREEHDWNRHHCADFLLHQSQPNLYSINATIVTVVLFHFRKFWE